MTGRGSVAGVTQKQQLKIGQRVADRYVVEEFAGRGSFGEVYRARDERLLGAPVALKLVDDYTSVVKEIESLLSVDHPHVVRVTDFGALELSPYREQPSGSGYFVMPWIAGDTLAGYIDALGRMSPPHQFNPGGIKMLGEQLCDALGAVHRQGLIHRDVKSQNVMLKILPARRFHATLLDFGSARRVTMRSMTSQGRGTEGYMSPEQFVVNRGDVTPASDVFSLAVTLWEATTRTWQAPGRTLWSELVWHTPEKTSVHIKAHCGALPGAVQDVLCKALSRQSMDRHADGDALGVAWRAAWEKPEKKGRSFFGWIMGERSASAPPPMPSDQVADQAASREGVAPAAPAPVAHASRVDVPPVPPTGSPSPGHIPTSPGGPVRAPTLIASADELREARRPTRLGWFNEEMPVGMEKAPIEVVTDVFTKKPREERFYHWRLPSGDLMDMVWVPAGEFVMGSDDGDADAFDDEKPAHRVQITRGFYLGRFPVTRGQYEKSPIANNSREWKTPLFDQDVLHPVVKVSWDESFAFAEWSRLELVNEANWEYAARGTDRRRYPWGNQAATNDLCVMLGAHGTRSVRDPRYLGVPSSFGAKHLAGNVWEWCADDWGSYALEGGKDPFISDAGTDRVFRGGAWLNDARSCRAAFRSAEWLDHYGEGLGLRLALGQVSALSRQGAERKKSP